jgi:hypothetical protein
MKKILFLTIITMVIFLSVVGGSFQTKAAEGHWVFLPVVMKPFPEPQCNIVVANHVPNYVTFDVSCQNVPNGWAHIQFDVSVPSHDSAETDFAITNGVGFTSHYYPWPFTSFTARLTVTGLDNRGHEFDIPVYIYWP